MIVGGIVATGASGQQAPIPIAPIPVAVVPTTQTPVAPPPSVAKPVTQIPAGTPAPIPATPNFKPGEPAVTAWAPFPQTPARATPPTPAQTATFTKAPGQTVTAQPTNAPAGAVPATPMVFVKSPDQEKPKKPADTLKKPDSDKEDSKDSKDKDEADDKDSDKKKSKTPVATIPNKEDVFRLDSDSTLDTRILDETRKTLKGGKLPVVSTPVGAGMVYQPKTATYSPVRRNLEPNYLVHGRLFFEDKNSERGGWDFGIIQPTVSALHFYKDFVMLPHNLASAACGNRWDTSVGKCNGYGYTPYYLYPPGFTITGLMGAATFYTGLPFIFP